MDGSGDGERVACPSWSDVVRFLVHEGQFAIAGGGWVQHDESLVSVGGALEQLTLGRRRLREWGLAPPTSSWQVDSFGHTTTTAALLRGMGYTSHILNRLPYTTKAALRWRRELEGARGRCRAAEDPRGFR